MPSWKTKANFLFKEELELAVKNSKFDDIEIPWEPTLAQQMLLKSQADYIFFGGKAGSGKTYALIYLALKHIRSLICRREYPQLKGIIDLSIKLFGGSNRYNRTEKIWDFGIKKLEFGAVQYEHDVEKYQGREHSLKGFDEITHFTYHQFIYLSGWCRSPDQNVKPQVVATGNPPTSLTGMWVIDFWSPWIDKDYTKRTGRPKALPGELRWFVVYNGKDIEVDSSEPHKIIAGDKEELLIPKSRTFIPGEMVPQLQEAGYKATLQQLPNALRKALLEGSFDVEFENDAFQILPVEWVEAAMARWKPVPSLLNPTHIGGDVGRGGDNSGFAIRYGTEIIEVTEKNTIDSDAFYQHLSQRLIFRNAGNEPLAIQIDATGVGAAVIDTLSRIKKKNWAIIALDSSGSPATKEGKLMSDKSGLLAFANLRAFWWWNLRNLLDPELDDTRGFQITLPPSKELKEELCIIRYEETSTGKIKVESKNSIKKADRLGRSPNLADAVVYAFALSPNQAAKEKWMGFMNNGLYSKNRIDYRPSSWK